MNSEQQNRFEYKSKSIFANIKFNVDNKKEDGNQEFAVPAQRSISFKRIHDNDQGLNN
jgi:hypothetical protein